MKRIGLLLLIITIFIVSLACNLPTVARATAVPLPQTAVDPAQILNQAVKVDPTNKTVTLTITEAQINALTLSQLAKYQSEMQVNITQPAVKLQDGLITLTGQVENGPLKVDFKLSLKPSVTADHKLSMEVVDSNFGALPVTGDIAKQIAAQVTTVVNQSITDSGEQLSVDSITISDGKMVVIAHR